MRPSHNRCRLGSPLSAGWKVIMINSKTAESEPRSIRSATLRFAGDSGDGMQLVGTLFAHVASFDGAVVRTFPDYPSEIRTTAGSHGGVSSFKVTVASHEVHSPADSLDVLIVANPAALRLSLPDLRPGGLIIANEDEFTADKLQRAEYARSPLRNGDLAGFHVVPISMTQLSKQAVCELQLSFKELAKCKGLFALGLALWLFDRPLESAIECLSTRLASHARLMSGNLACLRAGYGFAETTTLQCRRFKLDAPVNSHGEQRRLVTGNEAAALGLAAAAHRAARPLIYASYPITPASEILQELLKYERYDVRTIQAEDEIAACAAAIGASFGGALGATGTSGPGLSLMAESLGLAVMVELPLIAIDVQRGGPSTGMPTKTEQSDLLMAMYGRHGECPLVVLAAATPADCFDVVIEAARLAMKYMTPVMVLSDFYLAESLEPWKVIDPATLPDLCFEEPSAPEGFSPYQRDTGTLARPWLVPGTPGGEHCVGGLEKEATTGAISYDGPNHQRMVELRATKLERIACDIPPAQVVGSPEGDVLVVGWGSTYGAIAAAVDEVSRGGGRVARLHLRHLNPFPSNLKTIFSSYERILVPENNSGQLSCLLRQQYLVDVVTLCQIQGRPFRIREIRERIESLLAGVAK